MDREAAVERLEALGVDRTAKRFILSIKNGDRQIVELFLDSGFPADSRDSENNPAVVVARRCGQFEIARLLLARGASSEGLLRPEAKTEEKQKDLWDKITAISGILSFISSVLIAGVGGYFTYSYNQRQIELNRTQAEHDAATKEQGNKVVELEAIQKLIPSLTSKNEMEKAAALTAVQDLAHPALAAHLAVLFKGQGSVQYLQQALGSADSGVRQQAATALASISASGTGSDAQGASRALIIDQARKSVFVVRSRERESIGSGFCIASDGVVLTAAHVIASLIPAGSLGSGDVNHQATFEVVSGAKVFQASVVGIDRESDIAVLRVGGTFTPLTLFSGEPLVGTEVFGIGYDGSALGNSSSVASPTVFFGNVARVDPNKLIADAMVYPGMSGSPLLDGQGRVVGMISGKEEVGAIAVPSITIRKFLTSIHVATP